MGSRGPIAKLVDQESLSVVHIMRLVVVVSRRNMLSICGGDVNGYWVRLLCSCASIESLSHMTGSTRSQRRDLRREKKIHKARRIR